MGYCEDVQEFRDRKDAHFRTGKGPIPEDVLDEFTGLSYYGADRGMSYVLPLTRAALDASAEFTLETNTGEPRVMARYGTVTVPMLEGEYTLSVFAPLGEDAPQRVFIPFRDATSGNETYGAGRYLDAPVAQDEAGNPIVNVDFNMAYHPYCAYSDGWTCPLPPLENWLPEAVRAGERLPVQAN